MARLQLEVYADPIDPHTHFVLHSSLDMILVYPEEETLLVEVAWRLGMTRECNDPSVAFRYLQERDGIVVEDTTGWYSRLYRDLHGEPARVRRVEEEMIAALRDYDPESVYDADGVFQG